MFDSIDDLGTKLAATGYFIDPVMTQVVFLAAKLQKPLLLEGPAGSGKTQLAVSVAAAARTHIERLQCYRGVTEDKAIGRFDEGLQRLYMEFSKGQHENWQTVQANLKGRDFFRPGPLMRALECDRPCVLLIDELDKVDDGFEAMLLEILSAWQLSIPEFGTVAAKSIPFVVLTSNEERRLGDPSRPHGICEVKLSKGKTVYEGKRLSLAEMRRMGRKEWRKRFAGPTFFITGKDKGKLGYFWEHVYLKAKSGPNLGGVVNPDSGVAILDSEMQKLTALDFTDKLKVSEALTAPRGGTTRYSALWQADRSRIQRMAPIEYVGRYMRGWFDFAIADELHQLAGDTAQGNGLGVLGRAAQRLIALTGTLMGGYADDLFNIFYRMEPHAMVREGFAYGGQGRRDFQEQYGVLETIEKVEESDNACSRATKKTVRVLRKPGASPMLFGKFLMTTTAFLSLEDISDNLPRYDESVISVDMDDVLQRAYEQLEEDIRSAMKAHRGNKSLMSILLNTLLLYPDHPYDFDEIWARAFDPQTKEYVKFLVTEPANLTREALYAKERALIADVKEELRQGRRCQVYATYTGEKDVTSRLETVLRQEGYRVAVLRSSVATDKREDWYDRQLKAGVEVVICHPKLVETGLDLLAFPTLYFYETGYSLHTLRQASRRSWRIGQRFPVRVKFVTYSGTMQETCLRLMGKKMLVALMMEGKFSGEGLQALDTDEDLMSAMARELVEKAGVGESADAVWRDLGHEREKVLPRPTSMEPETEEESDLAPDLPGLIAAEPAPTPFGIHLIEPNLPSKKRKKAAVWPTATETNVQLSLFD